MKIAVPVTTSNQIDDNFSYCYYFNVYTISDKKEIEYVQKLKSEQICEFKSNIAGALSKQGVSIMLAGGISSGDLNVLNKWGIQVVRGCSGNAEDIIKQYMKGNISDNGKK